MFDFEKFITPRIISGLYVGTLVFLVIEAVINFLNRNLGAAVAVIFLAIISRMIFECVMVAFMNHEYLKKIAESLEKKKEIE